MLSSIATIQSFVTVTKDGELHMEFAEEFQTISEELSHIISEHLDFSWMSNGSSVSLTLQLIPEGNNVREEVHVVSLQMVDNEPYLRSLFESISPTAEAAVCEKCLFASPKETEFVYQTRISGIMDDGIIHKNYNGHSRIKWKAQINEKKVIFGISLPPVRLEEKDPIVSAKPGDQIRVSQIRPPQTIEWFEKEGMIEKNQPGATKNRASVYMIQDNGKMSFGRQRVGYHELFFEGERVRGNWILKYVPGARSHEWVLEKQKD